MTGIDLYDGITLHQGDCRDIMRELPAEHFDAVITDPPYGITFMGEKWDTTTPHGFQSWAQSWGEEALRVIKPGGYLLAFSAPRTYHRLTSGLEDAGLKARDTMAWIFTDRKPAAADLASMLDREASVLDQREGHTIEQFDTSNSTTNISNYKLQTSSDPITNEAKAREGLDTSLKPSCEHIVVALHPIKDRLVNNVRTHGTSAMNIPAGMDTVNGLYPPNPLTANQPMATAAQQSTPDHMWPVFQYIPKAPKREHPIMRGVQHITVKPLELMRYLIRLVMRPGALILEPFAGSETTLQATAMENTRAIGCELNDRYIPLIKARFAQGIEAPPDLFGMGDDTA